MSNQQFDPKTSHLQSKFMPQARLSILILSKAYSTKGILSPLTRHERLLAGGVCFAEKHLIVSPCFQVLAFRSQFRLTILDEQLSANNHGGKHLSFINQPPLIIIIFLFLLYVAEVLSSLINREKRTIRIEFLNLAWQT
jgi:hypothetical protein